MLLLEEVSEDISSKGVTSGVEFIVSWLQERLASFCGMLMSQEEHQKLCRIIRKRMTTLLLNDPIQYYQLLDSPSEEGITEWEQLLSLFMNGETFFFRDNGQFTLLKEYILPTLIHDQKAARTLRLLSVGCSTGEEAYSLAILIDQLLPDRENWEIDIFGLDINFRSIHLARQGIYGHWAFRKVDSEIQQQYFREEGSQWVLNETIRKMVTFHRGNIVADAFSLAALGIHDLDLILCRNVFLYFHHEAIENVVKKLAEALSSEGYFLTGHGELPVQAVDNLQARIFPDSVIYQRPHTMCVTSH